MKSNSRVNEPLHSPSYCGKNIDVINKKLQADCFSQAFLCSSMDKIQLVGQNLVVVFNFRCGYVHVMQLRCYEVKLSNLKLKTCPKQLFGYLTLDFYENYQGA